MTEAAVAARLAAVRERIAAACARAGRRASEVTLIGAAKGQPVARLAAACAAGLADFGENRVQEALAKAPQLPGAVRWHLLGPLQTNKAKKAAGFFASFHALDRVDLGQALARHAAAAGRRLPCFLEVNVAGEPTKHGFAPDELTAALEPLLELSHLELHGLMAIPPWDENREASRPWFRALARLRDDLVARAGGRLGGGLSMGMSDDFEVAIEEGATHVRIGTALFGERGGTA